MNPIQDQGQCGSCWAFSAVQAMESRWEIKSGKLEKLSEQQLVDCSGEYGNQGCNGGYESTGIDYGAKYGMETEDDYPYTGYDGNCDYDKSKTITWTLKGHQDVTANSPTALKTAIADGPTTVAIEAD